MPASCLPFLMFQGEGSRAVDFYLATFSGAKLDAIEKYGDGEQGAPGTLKMALFTVAGQQIRAFDSPPVHAFAFTPSLSFFVECESEQELRQLADTLSGDGATMMAVDNYGFSKLYAWVADRFGVAWQLNLS